MAKPALRTRCRDACCLNVCFASTLARFIQPAAAPTSPLAQCRCGRDERAGARWLSAPACDLQLMLDRLRSVEFRRFATCTRCADFSSRCGSFSGWICRISGCCADFSGWFCVCPVCCASFSDWCWDFSDWFLVFPTSFFDSARADWRRSPPGRGVSSQRLARWRGLGGNL